MINIILSVSSLGLLIILENIFKSLCQLLLKNIIKESRSLIHNPYNTLIEQEREYCNLMLLYNDDLRRVHKVAERDLSSVPKDNNFTRKHKNSSCAYNEA